MAFSKLGLSDPLLKAIKEQGYTDPTPVQKQAIPIVLSGKDVLAGAQTGTGKTAGFTLPLLQILSKKEPVKGRRPVRALILTPTRELAAQVHESVETYGKHLPYRSMVIFGGVGMKPQIDKLRKGVDIVIATPGRLLDLIGQKALRLSDVEHLILDEADRMLDMGFIHDIKKVMALMPKKRQTLLFSATFSPEIKALADSLLFHPTLIEVARQNTASETVAQVVHPVDKTKKRGLLTKIINDGNWQQVLVFTRTKHGADRLSKQLTKDGINAAAIHGNKSQGARTRALANFKAGAVRVLVATDIAARGIDIDLLPHVVNFELPNMPEDYVHRIGRTGRAGNEGEAVSLVSLDELNYLRDIERLIKKKIPKVVIEGFAPDPNIKPEPIEQRGGRRNRSTTQSNNKQNAKNGHKPQDRQNRNNEDSHDNRHRNANRSRSRANSNRRG
ncbi:MAG: ATP-dependent RNA helicase RhlE [Desulfocapsa sp.]|nr:MAG: ATP-dependent RNA helicase RhlE [Desulfocapsa sp.]